VLPYIEVYEKGKDPSRVVVHIFSYWITLNTP